MCVHMCTGLVLRVPLPYVSTQTGLPGQAEMVDGVDLNQTVLVVGPCVGLSTQGLRLLLVKEHAPGDTRHRSEPRPVHITLIATCRVYNSRQQLIQLLLSGPPQGYETRPTVESTFFQSRSRARDLGRCLSSQ
jgi:hypothetical protein